MFEFSVKKPVAVSIIMIALVALGLYFRTKVSLEFFPTLDIPVVSIITIYQGAGPQEIEEQITKKIEDQVGTVGRLKKIRSTSQDNASVVIAEFYYGTNMVEALSDVRDKLELAKMSLPQDARQPIVSKFDPSSSPVMILTLSGEMSLTMLRTLADDNVKKELEKVAGVASVTVSGGYEREVSIMVDEDKLRQLNISPGSVLAAVQAENLNVPSGNILTPDQQIQIRVVGQFNDLENIRNVYVAQANGRNIFIRDIAQVKDTNKEQASITRNNGVACVSLEIRRNTDSNVVDVCDKVNEATLRLNKILPKGALLSVVSDDSELVRKSVHAMQETALEATLLAVLVIFLFLSSFRSTIIVSLSIPISIFATFIMMYFNNISMNIITLSAFTLAIGRVVDDSIVVLENIFRYIENGYEPFKAAIEGTKEVGLAVLASTLTTMSVFLPLLIVAGIAGQFFGPLAKTFMTAILVSLVVALLLIPMLSARVIKLEDVNKPKKGLKVITEKWQKVFNVIEQWYEKALKFAASHLVLVLISSFLIFCFSLFVLTTVPLSFQPKMDRNFLSATIETPVGTSLVKTDNYIKQVEKIAKEEFPEETKYAIARAGVSNEGSSPDPTQGSLSLQLKNKKERKRDAMAMQDIFRQRLSKIPGLIFSTDISGRRMGGADIEFIIKGDDLTQLSSLGERYKNLFARNIKGASELNLSWKKGKPEYRIEIDHEKAAQYGVNLASIGTSVANYVRGFQVSDINKYKEGGRDYDITVQLPRENRESFESLSVIPIKISENLTVPLSALATIVNDDAPSKVTRDARARSISITGSPEKGYQSAQVVANITAFMKHNPLPSGYSWQIGGEEEDRKEVFTDMFTSLILAVFLVYGILAVQFESFIHPLTIMMAVPLEIIGVAIALKITGEPLSMVVILALIMLTGIVVSNSILLVNYIIVLRTEQGLKRSEAIFKAGPTRLRPILMTTMATCIAMIPLALSLREGGEFFAPLGKVVIGGLISSTMFTLLVVPCFYIVMDNIAIKLHLAKKDE